MFDLLSFYNTMAVLAPEIKGQWEVYALPGVRQPDGSIRRSGDATGVASILLKLSLIHILRVKTIFQRHRIIADLLRPERKTQPGAAGNLQRLFRFVIHGISVKLEAGGRVPLFTLSLIHI